MSAVNGEPRQDSNTADMIFGVADLIRHLSHYLTFEPGDLVCTGTPQGVAMGGRFPYLQPGDIVECGIDGLGTMRQTVVAR
jgi:2,4-didehydro-3-deoxy-L-rhamnonate hydrolase